MNQAILTLLAKIACLTFAAVALFCLASTTGCTDESDSVHALKSSGFTEIQTTGYAWFSCSDSDSFHTGFRAKNAKGDVVEGVVCCGMLKACAVRF